MKPRGFTLVELCIVIVVIGLLAAIATPNYISMQNRAKEASVKANMHVFQLAAEGIYIDSEGLYPARAEAIASHEGLTMVNPFSKQTGSGKAWETRGNMLAPPTLSKPGIVSYASQGSAYNIKGQGEKSQIQLVLTNPE